MNALVDALRSLTFRQIGVLVAVALGAVGITYGVYAVASGPDRSELEADQQQIPVRYGDLINEVSISGSLIFPDRDTLTFGIPGTIAELMVVEGQAVEAGQALAILDVETISALVRTVAQSQIDLRDAEDALAEANDPHTPLDLAQAEQKVSEAMLALDSAQDALTRLLEPPPLEAAEAEAKVAEAKLELQDARVVLDTLLDPSPREFAEAEAVVAGANLTILELQDELDTAVDGPAAEDIAEAQSQVNSAAVTLSNALGDLKLTRREWDTKAEVAQDAFDEAFKDYRDVFKKWLGADLDEAEANMHPDALLASWNVDIGSLFEPQLRFQDIGQWSYTDGSPSNDPATRWDEGTVYAWLNFFPGNILATCEDGVTDPQISCIGDEMHDAWERDLKAADELDTVQTQEAKAVANAQGVVSAAEESQLAAEEQLSDVLAAAELLEIADMEKRLALALTIFADAEEALYEMEAGPDSLEVETQQKLVGLAEARLAEADETWTALIDGADLLALDAGRNQVAVESASLAEAEEELADLKSSVDPLEVAFWEAEVASSRARLDAAVQRVNDSTLRAPSRGVISVVNIENGDAVNATTPVIELVDPTVVEVDGIVDEIDVLFIREGARATVTMDAMPDRTLEGIVSALDSVAQNQQGVVSYPIRIRVTAPDGTQLPEGLSAIANVVIREDRDVLLVPIQAIYGTFDQPAVRVMFNGRVEERPVVLGNSDDFWAVVQGGLSEGDIVVMEAQQTATGQFGFGGGFRRFQSRQQHLPAGPLPGGGFRGSSGGRQSQQQADHD